jgi:hypothetical protein
MALALLLLPALACDEDTTAPEDSTPSGPPNAFRITVVRYTCEFADDGTSGVIEIGEFHVRASVYDSTGVALTENADVFHYVWPIWRQFEAGNIYSPNSSLDIPFTPGHFDADSLRIVLKSYAKEIDVAFDDEVEVTEEFANDEVFANDGNADFIMEIPGKMRFKVDVRFQLVTLP